MVRSMILTGTALFLASGALAAPADVEKCRAIADPAQRLACYDQAAGQASGPAAPAAQIPRRCASPLEQPLLAATEEVRR